MKLIPLCLIAVLMTGLNVDASFPKNSQKIPVSGHKKARGLTEDVFVQWIEAF